MKLVVLGAGKFDGSELEGFAIPAAWRKATRNMIMATASIERALQTAPGLIDSARDEIGLVLGSNSGELETSSEFLTTLSRTRVARPVLFQNSLHNATTGFASIHFRLTGPTFTVSSGRQNPREALILAQALMAEEFCRACLVTLVEAHKLLANFIGCSVAEGAATVLLARQDFAASVGMASAPELQLEEWAGDFPVIKENTPLFAIDSLPFYRQAAAGVSGC